ncbi:MAG: MFS transporter [Anaerolineales bacterium]|uniref:MFS transporter n=1 Tax=Candidatus Desulfolinea nitratireducens TaxID=2841698 RepID=A0A8J6TED0_9CHLR|nr:MFS transporter [Candidatus Desulfolinea nitratireducens]
MKATQTLRIFNTRLRNSVTQFATGGNWAIEFSKGTRHNLRSFFFDGVSASASDSIILTYLTLYLLSLGGGTADVGLMTSLASLSAVLLLIPGAKLVDRTGKRKMIVLMSGGGIRRIAILLLAMVPLAISGKAAIYVVIALMVIMDGMGNLGLPAWISMTADIVPLSKRGRYFGTRNMAMGVSKILTTFIVGLLITRIGSPVGFQWAMGLAFIFGMISTSYFSRINETEFAEKKPFRGKTESYSIKALISTLRSDRNFTLFCIYTAVWTFSLSLAGPFFSVYMVQDLKATAAFVGVTSIVSALSSIPAQKLFGPLADKWGARKLILVTSGIIPILPLMWYFTSEPWHVFPINTIGGALWAGYGIATFNFLLSVSPAEQRARYTALYQISVASSAALGAALGGVVANYLGLNIIFLLSGIGRFMAAGIFAKFVHSPTEEQACLQSSGQFK